MKSQDVLKKIHDLAANRTKEKPLGIDTLGLILKIGEPQLMLLLRELESEGKITIVPQPEMSRRRTGSGGILYNGENPNNTMI